MRVRISFNFSIGKLYEDIEPKQLNHFLHISNINSTGIQVLKRVIENFKQFYSDNKKRIL